MTQGTAELKRRIYERILELDMYRPPKENWRQTPVNTANASFCALGVGFWLLPTCFEICPKEGGGPCPSTGRECIQAPR